MKVAIEASLLASFSRSPIPIARPLSPDDHSANDLYSLLKQAYGTENAGTVEDLPLEWRDREPLLCLYPEGDARVYLLKPEEPIDASSTIDKIPLIILILNKNDTPSPERCIEAAMKRLAQANRLFGRVRVSLPDDFRLFPITNDGIDDKEHHFNASRCSQSAQLKESTPILIGILFFAMLSFLISQTCEYCAPVANFFGNALIGAFITKLIDNLFKWYESKFMARLDIDQTLKKEEQHLLIRNTRTSRTVDTYRHKTNVLTRSEGNVR